MERFTIDLHGPLHGMDYGGEGRLVLLVHGLSGSAVNWVEVAEPLTAYGHVVASELPGFGRTPPAGRSFSMEAQARLMADFIEYQGGGPALVIGNSMGAMISMILAGRRPDLVDGLVLIDTPGSTPSFDGMSRSWIVSMLLYLVPGVGGLFVKWLRRQGTPESTTDVSFDLLAGEPGRMSASTRRLHARVIAERNTMPWPPKAYLGAFRSVVANMVPFSRWTRTALQVRAPTLLLHGTHDSTVPVSAGRAAGVHPARLDLPAAGRGRTHRHARGAWTVPGGGVRVHGRAGGSNGGPSPRTVSSGPRPGTGRPARCWRSCRGPPGLSAPGGHPKPSDRVPRCCARRRR